MRTEGMEKNYLRRSWLRVFQISNKHILSNTTQGSTRWACGEAHLFLQWMLLQALSHLMLTATFWDRCDNSCFQMRNLGDPRVGRLA